MAILQNKLRVNHLVMIPVTICSAILIILFIAWTSDKPNSKPNGFTRKLAGHTLKEIAVKKKDKSIQDFAGITRDNIYFKTNVPGEIVVTDHDLEGKRIMKFLPPVHDRLADFFYCFFDSPSVKILAGNIPAIFEVGADLPPKMYQFPSALFTRVVKIGPNSYVFRGLDTTMKTADQIFIKGNPVTGEIIRQSKLLTGAHDAGISTDGYLNYDDSSALLVFTLFDKNSFYCLDTNLNIVYSAHTVDTVNRTHHSVGVVNIESEKMLTNKAPDITVNKLSITHNGKLYNVSALKADNETDDGFGRNSIIDVYDIKNGSYLSSFYIPSYKWEKVYAFKIVGNRLIALYNSNIVVYDLGSLNR